MDTIGNGPQVKHFPFEASESRKTRLTSDLASVGEGVIVTDVNGRVEFINAAAERLIGIKSTEAQGRTLLQVLQLEEKYGDAVTGDLAELAFISESTVSLGKDLLLIPHNGHIIDVEGEICARKRGTFIVGAVVTFRDVSARKWEELQRREGEKMRAVSELAKAVAHSLNNCLTAVVGHTELLQNKYPESRSLRVHTDAIQQATQTMTLVARQLLALSRSEILTSAPTDMNEVLGDLAPRLRRALSTNVKLNVGLAPDLGRIFIDPGRMEQALLDLVRYAESRTHSGGTIDLSATKVVRGGDCRARHHKSFVRIAIHDTGPSLAATAAEELFEPRWCTNSTGSFNLGLYGVRNVVSASQGHLSVESEVRRGATFVLLFPCMDEEVPGAIAAEESPKSVTYATVLLVEDDDAIRILLRNSLEESGYQVIEARDGEEALLQAEMHEDEQIDLLISDVVMPNIDGPALARKLLATHSSTKILLISGCPKETAEVQHLVLCGAHYLVKPFSQRELLAEVERVLRGPRSQ